MVRVPENAHLARTPRGPEDVITPGHPLLLGVHEAAKTLGVSAWTVRDLVRGGHLPRVKLPCGGGKLLVRFADLIALVNQCVA